MKIEHGLRLPLIVPMLVLALLLNPFAYALPQESAASPGANGQSNSRSDDDGQTTQSPSVMEQRSSNGAPAQPVAAPADSSQPSSNKLPDSPGSVEVRSDSAQPGSAQSSSAQSSPAQSGSVESAQLAPSPVPSQTPAQAQPQPQPKEPLGTAAAQTVPTMGVAASQPAGAALAPAKQRRVRTILIRVGAILAVGAAVGVTVALSEGSPSKPPGAR